MLKNLGAWLWSTGLAGAMLSLSLIGATWALWALLWPYIALLILALMTAIFWGCLDALWRLRHHMLAPVAVETAGRVPQVALNQYQASVDNAIDNARWEQAYRLLTRVAHNHGDQYSLEGLRAHVECSNWRALWEHSKTAMLGSGEMVRHKKWGMVFTDYHRLSVRLGRGHIVIPPCPGVEIPVVNVWARVPCTVCMAEHAEHSPASENTAKQAVH